MRWNETEPLLQFSPYGGGLVLEEVPGSTSGRLNPENDVDVAQGQDRSMYVYVPASGCPHAKQTQVLMVYRDDASRESAQELLDGLGLAGLAEERHFVAVFPNPLECGWNFNLDPAREDDTDFVVRCFAALPRSRGGVAGFNGMIFHLATSLASSALVTGLARTRPLDAAAVMVGALPTGYVPPAPASSEQVRWTYGCAVQGLAISRDPDNSCVAHYEHDALLSAEEVRLAWDLMFSEARRWRNDTFGTYQPRTHFDEMGFVAHVDDAGLGLADGLPRTWFEYVPAHVAASESPVPLVIYLHGINCCGTYGAEQSDWAHIAERDGLMAVFPTATIEDRWNVWDDPRLPSDVSYVLALIEHMDAVHPVDRSRIYVSGFSMGSMFTNTLAAAYPDVFAGAVAFNGPALGLLETLDDSRAGMLALQRKSRIADLTPREDACSPVSELAARKSQRYRIPLVQFVGLLDSVGLGDLHAWPVQGEDDGLWPGTVRFWRAHDEVGGSVALLDSATPTGLGSNSLSHEDRYWVQRFVDSTGEALYELVAVERLPHAVDLTEVEMGWDVVRRWARGEDGSLVRVGEPNSN